MPMKMKHWQDPVNLIAGIWMIISPWVLAYRTDATPTWNAVIVGFLIALAALYALYKVFAWEEWTNVALGVWLIISPWVLGFSSLTTATYNHVIVGVIVGALALWALGTDRDIGGWMHPAH